MKVLKSILIPITLIFFSCGNQNEDSTSDSSKKVNNKTLNIKGAYDNVETIVIGDLEWMIEDLKVTHYRNGDPIDVMPQRFIDNGYRLEDYDVPARIGSSYNIMAIDDPRGLFPAGWRIPSMKEWNNLIDILNNGVHQNIDYNKLKSCFPLSSISAPINNYTRTISLFAFKHYMTSSFDIHEWKQNKRKFQENMKYIRDEERKGEKNIITESVDTNRQYESIWLWTKNEHFDSIALANGTLQYPGKVIKCVRRVLKGAAVVEEEEAPGMDDTEDTAEEAAEEAAPDSHISLKMFRDNIQYIEYVAADRIRTRISDVTILSIYNKLYFESKLALAAPSERGEKICDISYAVEGEPDLHQLSLFKKLNDTVRLFILKGFDYYTAQYHVVDPILFQFTIKDADGWSNLRETPRGQVIKKIYEGETFIIVHSDNDYYRIVLQDGTIGYLHKSRMQKLNLKL